MAGLIEMATLCWKADFDNGKLNIGVKNAESQINGLKDKTSGISSFLNKTILGGVLGITGGLAGMATAGLKSATDLQTSMKGFQAQTGLTADETDKVKNSVKDMFVATGKSYEEIAKMATQLHNQLGMSSADIDKYGTSFSKYAKVTKQDTGDMVTAIGGIKNAWHLGNADIQPIMDKLILSQQKYGLSIDESQQSLKTLAPAFSAMGMNVNQAISYLDLFKKAGLNCEGATIAFQTALKKVKNPEELQDIITKMQNTKNDTERAKIAMEVFGKQGLAMAQAMKPGSQSLADIQKSLEGATGATDKAASAMGGTLATTVAKLKRTLQDFLEGTMEKMLPSIQGFANYIQSNMPTIQTTLASAFNIAGKAVGILGDGIKYATEHSKILIPVIAGLAGGLGALKVIETVNGLMTAWKASTIAQTLAQGGLNGVLTANPIGIVCVSIGLLITAGIALYKNWDIVSAKLKVLETGYITFKNSAMDKIKEAVESVTTGFNNFKIKLEDITNNIIASAKQKFDDFKKVIDDNATAIKITSGILGTVFAPALIKTAIEAVTAGAKVGGSFISSIITSGVESVISGAKITASFIASMAKAGMEAVVNAPKILASFVASVVTSGAESVIAGGKIIGSFVASMIQVSVQAIATSASITGKLIASIVSYAIEGWKAVASITAQTGALLAQTVQTGASTIALVTHKVATLACSGVTTAMTAAQWALNAAFVATPWGWVALAIGGVIAAGVLLYKNWDKISAGATKLWGGIKETFGNIGKHIGDTWDKAKENTSKAWEAIQGDIEKHGGGIKGVIGTGMDIYVGLWKKGFEFMDNISGGKLSAIKDKFTGIWEYIKEIGNNIKSKLTGMFDFDLPHIKLPHFDIKGKFSIDPPSIPHVGVNWYDKGGIFNSAQIIGVGEKRPEFVGALDDLRYLIRDELNRKSTVNNNNNGATNVYNTINQDVKMTNNTPFDVKNNQNDWERAVKNGLFKSGAGVVIG